MNKPISEMTIDEKAITALCEAVRKAQERQWKLGLPVWVVQDGKIVNLPPPPDLRFSTKNQGEDTP